MCGMIKEAARESAPARPGEARWTDVIGLEGLSDRNLIEVGLRADPPTTTFAGRFGETARPNHPVCDGDANFDTPRLVVGA